MRTVEKKQSDNWRDWRPQWTGQDKTPHDLQEKHAPSERQPDDISHDQYRRRIIDARLWNSLAPLQQEAAMLIAGSFDMVSNGANYATSNWERLPGTHHGSNISEARARLINIYFGWARKCAERKISHAMVADILCFGHSCRSVDNNRRLRNGSTKINLMRGLSLYCELRGWV